jgi:hypothetical protein
MIEHGPVLSQKVSDALQRCTDLASINKFASSPIEDGNMKIAQEAAEEVLKRLKQIEEQLVNELKS